MTDLINRAKAIEELEDMAEYERKHGDALFAEGIDAAANRLRIMRHENPVVRCKDCKHCECNTWDSRVGDEYTCELGRTMFVDPDHFCSHGERKISDAK